MLNQKRLEAIKADGVDIKKHQFASYAVGRNWIGHVGMASAQLSVARDITKARIRGMVNATIVVASTTTGKIVLDCSLTRKKRGQMWISPN